MTSNPAKVVIVGGTSGIGLATAKRLVADGFDVHVIGRRAEALTAALTESGAAGGDVADASDPDALNAVFERVGEIDHLVITASGGRGAGAFSQLDPAGLRAGFDGKFWAHLTAARVAQTRLRKGGSIVFVTAASARFANPGTSGLAAINGAIQTMAQTLARELAPLRVNVVSPGVIKTPWWSDKPAEMFDAAADRAPLKRPGEPEEVAEAIRYLIGADYVTGVILDVDGGLHLT